MSKESSFRKLDPREIKLTGLSSAFFLFFSGFFSEARRTEKRIYTTRVNRGAMYLPLIHVPLKLLGDNEPESHSSREMPGAPFVLDAVESGLPVRRIAAAITRANTIIMTMPQVSKRHRYRCLFFVMRSCKYYYERASAIA